MKIALSHFLFLLGFALLTASSHANAQDKTVGKNDWKEKLYEKNVQYQDYACDKNDASLVADFFIKHPLSSIFFVCHNNCAVVQSNPKVEYPAGAAAVRAQGLVMVHVLANEDGKAIFARVLTGNPLLATSAKNAACKTVFKRSTGKRQNVISFCYGDCKQLTNID